jgi:hypothetical protein
VVKPQEFVSLSVIHGDKEILSKKLRFVNPANMVEFYADIPSEVFKSSKGLEVRLDG